MCTLIFLSTLVVVCDHTLRGPVLGDHRGNQLSKLLQRTAGGAAWQCKGIGLMLGLVPIVHLHEVLSVGKGGGVSSVSSAMLNCNGISSHLDGNMLIDGLVEELMGMKVWLIYMWE